jgi:hypothetical protein
VSTKLKLGRKVHTAPANSCMDDAVFMCPDLQLKGIDRLCGRSRWRTVVRKELSRVEDSGGIH